MRSETAGIGTSHPFGWSLGTFSFLRNPHSQPL